MPLRRRAALAAAGAALSTLGACSLLRGASPIPMELLQDDRACPGTRAPALLVLLPGANMAPDELLREGFVAAVSKRGLAVDVVVADSHQGYVQDRSVLKRLRDEVIAPAQALGYRQIWLAGISLGGFLALSYAMRHPGDVTGLVTLAPYLGRRPLVQAMVAAGGPVAWRGTARPREADDLEHELWQWLSDLPADAPPLYLGYGSDDRFADAHRLLATLLLPPRVRTAPCGHDWPAWRALWAAWLDSGVLATACTT